MNAAPPLFTAIGTSGVPPMGPTLLLLGGTITIRCSWVSRARINAGTASTAFKLLSVQAARLMTMICSVASARESARTTVGRSRSLSFSKMIGRTLGLGSARICLTRPRVACSSGMTDRTWESRIRIGGSSLPSTRKQRTDRLSLANRHQLRLGLAPAVG